MQIIGISFQRARLNSSGKLALHRLPTLDSIVELVASFFSCTPLGTATIRLIRHVAKSTNNDHNDE